MSPDGAIKPDVFIVGAPRCGTTWLYRHLAVHPRVFMSRQKEPHHFNTDSRFRWVETLEAYESLFSDAPAAAQAIGEASVLYLHSEVAAANILCYQPRARFIAMVRNPLEMAPSWHRQALFDQQENEPDFARAWALQAERTAGRQVQVDVAQDMAVAVAGVDAGGVDHGDRGHRRIRNTADGSRRGWPWRGCREARPRRRWRKCGSRRIA